jgi:exoribonuclease R
VELKDTIVEGFVDADSLKSDNFYFNEQDFSLTGKQSGERYRMGDEVTIVVKDVAIEKRQSNFEIMLKK